MHYNNTFLFNDFKMRGADLSDNDFQFQLTAIFSDNGYQYQLKKILKNSFYYIHLKCYII